MERLRLNIDNVKYDLQRINDAIRERSKKALDCTNLLDDIFDVLQMQTRPLRIRLPRTRTTDRFTNGDLFALRERTQHELHTHMNVFHDLQNARISKEQTLDKLQTKLRASIRLKQFIKRGY